MIFVCMWFFGMYGFTFSAAMFMGAFVTLGMALSNPGDAMMRNTLMNKTAWLYLQCDETEKALQMFEAVAAAFESTMGASDYSTVQMKVGTILALRKCGRDEEAHQLAAQCIAATEAALRCPRYAWDQMCLTSGGFVCNWMSRLAEPMSVIRRSDWLAVWAGVLAADGRPDAEVLAVLDLAVQHGLMPHEHKSVVNTLGAETVQRFVQFSYAFAALTDAQDSHAARAGTPSQLDMQVHQQSRPQLIDREVFDRLVVNTVLRRELIATSRAVGV